MVVERVDGTDLKFKNPGRLLMVVFGFLFWAIGFIDLIGHTSADPDVFGLYSLPFFILIILYGSTIVVWFALFFNANLLSRVVDIFKYIQRRTWLAIITLIGFGFVFWVIFEWDRWLRLPGLQLAAFGLLFLALLIILFANWNESKGEQKWRMFIAYPLIALALIEAVVQLVVWFNFVPGTHTIGGDFVPYERIYNNAEGYRNDFANRKGWTFPDSVMKDSNNRILVVGGSYVQALQVEADQQVSSYLSELLNGDSSSQEQQTEIIGIGLPGFGPASFLYEDALIEIPQILPYDEMVVLFHLGDDFQSPELSHNAIAYTVAENGEVVVRPEDARIRHDLTHYYLRGYLSFQLVEALRSNYLTPKLVSSFLSAQNSRSLESASASEESDFDFTRLVGSVTSIYALNEPGHAGIKTTALEHIPQGNNFMFSDSNAEAFQEAVIIADSLLKTAHEITAANGVTLRIVTVPVFPEEFYTTYQENDWQARVGNHDLLKPEQALIDIAGKYDIPILPMGSFMLNDQLTVDQVRALYLSNGVGHFSPAGHEYFASAIKECFYSGLEISDCLE
jgi:hypothetical protein